MLFLLIVVFDCVLLEYASITEPEVWIIISWNGYVY